MPERSRPTKIDWVGLAQVILVIGVGAGLYSLIQNKQADSRSWQEVQQWLKHKGLSKLEASFKQKGLTSIEKLLEVEVEDHFHDYPTDVRHSVEEETRVYRDLISLKLWLSHRGLEHYYQRFQKYGVLSLSQLAEVTDGTLQRVTASDYTLNDYTYLKASLHDLGIHIPSYEQIKDYRPAGTILKHIWTFAGFVLFLLLVGTLILAVNMNYVGYARTRVATARAKHSIIEFVTGKYLSLQHCKVLWQWTEPQTVGKTVTFVIEFFQRNGSPYIIAHVDRLTVEIMLGSAKFPATVELGSPEPHTATVSFTVHKSGDYRISVLMGAKHIAGSPFHKRFKPGPLDPSKTGFVSQSAIVVCTKGIQHVMKVEPRDQYGNLCVLSEKKGNLYKISVTEMNSQYSYSPPLAVKHEGQKSINLGLTIEQEGCYQATATYNGTRLKTPDFTILVLSDRETGMVNKHIAKKSPNVYFEARLLTSCIAPYADKSPGDRVKKVYCYISSRQLTIKEYCLKIIPIRLFTFRVCPSTKFQFLGMHNHYNAGVLEIDDGCQPPVKLAAKDRNVIVAIMTNYLLRNIGGSETFKDKQDFFYQEIRSFHSKRPHDKIVLRINRANLLESTLKTTRNFTTSEWCKNFEIRFQGEDGVDWGGLRREWFEVICRELFDPNASGLFCRFKDDPQALVLPNAKRSPNLKLKLYEFAGRVVGKCLYESSLGGTYKQMVKARFTRSFLAQLIGLRVTYKNFEQDDPELYVSKVKYIEENSVEDMGMTFSEEEYVDGKLEKEVELVPNGSRIDVTDSNKLQYLDALAQYKLSRSVKDEIEAFQKGLNEMVPDQLLSMFDENELELLMCGTGTYSIADLKRHHELISLTRYHKILDWFWTILAGFTQEEMARLIQFTTGCSQLPPGGFAELNPKIQISHSHSYGSLPTAHTCFNQLCLPDYDSMEQMHRALLLAINEGNVGFGMV